MAAVAARTDVPLATNMCVIAMEHLPPAIAQDAVQVVLSDHHLWGGLRKSALLGGITEVWGMGLSMHSNSHLGVSLAAMVHLAAATPNLTYACDTHYPWKTEDVIAPGVLSFSTARWPCRQGPASASSSTATRSASCTSSTSPAAYAGARTPSTCARSGRTSRSTPPAGSRVSRCAGSGDAAAGVAQVQPHGGAGGLDVAGEDGGGDVVVLALDPLDVGRRRSWSTPH